MGGFRGRRAFRGIREMLLSMTGKDLPKTTDAFLELLSIVRDGLRVKLLEY
jgi:hypothetical protein